MQEQKNTNQSVNSSHSESIASQQEVGAVAATQKAPINILAFLALIFTFPFFGGGITGLGLGIAALMEIKRTHERGKTLAIIAIVLNSLIILAFLVFVIVIIVIGHYLKLKS